MHISTFCLAVIVFICGVELCCCQGDVCGTSPFVDAGVCGEGNATTQIVGGCNTRRHEIPHQVGLLWRGDFFCGGVLWDENHVITAQHCTETYPVNGFSVVLGDHNRSETDAQNPERRTIGITELIEHPDYDSYWLNDDIAILVLEEPVDIEVARTPICYDRKYAGNNTFDMQSSVSGWGAERDNGPLTEQLKHASLPMMSYYDCVNCDEFMVDEVKPGMICTGLCGTVIDQNACQGDSGGPLFVKGEDNLMYAVGLTSWGYGCMDPVPGVYTDLAYYEDWINDNINGASSR